MRRLARFMLRLCWFGACLDLGLCLGTLIFGLPPALTLIFACAGLSFGVGIYCNARLLDEPEA